MTFDYVFNNYHTGVAYLYIVFMDELLNYTFLRKNLVYYVGKTSVDVCFYCLLYGE